MTSPLLRKTLNLQPGEGRRAALMFSYIFLLIATLLVVKPVRNSLFLTRFGVEMLPWAFVSVAVASGGFVALYTKLAGRFKLDRLIQYTLGGSVFALLVFWVLLQQKFSAGWFYFLLYVWVAIFGVLVTTQFWLLANYVFDVREAKRIFGLLGAGGIAGGIFGGYFTNALASVGSEDLLLFGALFLIACMVLVQQIWQLGAQDTYRQQTQRRKSRREKAEDLTSPLRLIAGNRYLTLLASVIGIGVVVANLVDYQYSAIATSVIDDEDRLTAFFGFWLSTLSVFSLLIQLLLTSRVMRRYGVGGSLHFLPGGVLVGSIMVLVSGGLTSAVLIKLFEGGFKQSIHKAGLEMLSLPIPAAVKNRVKAFIDVFVDNIATGLGGLLLILFTGVWGVGVAGVSVIVLALVALWIVLNVVVRREYVQAFRAAIEQRSIRLDREVVDARDPALLDTVLKALDSGNEKQVLYALELMERVRHEEIARRLVEVLDRHPSRDVICRVLRLALQYDELDLAEQARGYLTRDDPEIRICAVEYLVRRSDRPVELLNGMFTSENLPQRLAALRVAAELRRNDKVIREGIDFVRMFEDMLLAFDKQTEGMDFDRSQLTMMRVELAGLLGHANLPELYPYLHMLLGDDSPEVLRAAVEAAGMTRSDEFIPTLIEHLNTKYVRKAARTALAMHGDHLLKTLAERMNDPRENLRVRLSLPRVIGGIGSQAAVNTLQANLAQEDVLLRHAVIKALNKLRAEYDDLRLDRESVDESLLEEARMYYFTLEILHTQIRGGGPATGSGEDGESFARAGKLLVRALEERLDRNLELIFRLLGLRYLPEDMHNAYRQVTGSRMDLRASAIELLDNVLDQRLKRVILPLVETPNIETRLERGRELFSLNPPDRRACLEALLQGDDVWLKVCALYFIGESGDTGLASLARAHLDARNEMVRETAQLALRRLEPELDVEDH